MPNIDKFHKKSPLEKISAVGLDLTIILFFLLSELVFIKIIFVFVGNFRLTAPCVYSNTFFSDNQIAEALFLPYNKYTIKTEIPKTYPHSPVPAARRLKRAILDALFPIFCAACREEGAWMCKRCLNEMKIADFQVCPVCEDAATDKGYLCRTCRNGRKSSLDGLIAAVSYKNPAIRKLVHNFKYCFVADISEPLAALISRVLIRNDFSLPDALIPVPLHAKRLRWRGFNQSLLLAEQISGEIAPLMKIEVLDWLERKKYNRPQMKIKNYRERLRNVKDIFVLKPDADPAGVRNKTVLLVDDIATTGATLEQCAKVLKSAGARKVFAAVVARQSLKK